MKFFYTFLLIFTLCITQSSYSQNKNHSFSIEIEPVAYLLGGAGATAGYQYGSWTYSVEGFGKLTIPQSLHGNNDFEATLRGIEFQGERFIQGTEGFYAGPEVGISRIEVTNEITGNSERQTNYSVGIRGGYHWQTGLGNLYLTPLAGISFSITSEDIQVDGQTFESGSFTPFATVGLGWRF